MEFVKRFGLWFIGGLLIAAALGFYFVIVRAKASQFGEAKAKLDQRRADLESWVKKKDTIATPKGIDAAEEYGNLVTAQLKDCERYLAAQPRRANTRIFFEDERLGLGQEKEFDIEANPWKWVDAYRKHNIDLQEQIRSAGFTAFTIQTLDSQWGTKPPTRDQVANAMELYWYQKDMADFLTEQAEKDFNELIKAQNEADAKPEPFPTKVSDLVLNRKPPRLDEFLRTLPQPRLIAVLEAILINEQQQDLPTIFNTLLPNDLPWERPAAESDKLSVLALTMDDQQRKYLEDLVPNPVERPDLANRQRFLDFVREVRGVRYRADVAGLLEGKTGFEDIAISVRKGTQEEHARIRTDIKNWSTTQLAQAIAEVVSIKEEKDYRFIRNNHSHGISELRKLTMKHANQGGGASSAAVADEGAGHGRRGAGGGAPAAVAAPGATELYKPSSFEMDVRIEFERIPVFLRRLLSNNWRYKVHVQSVVPVEGATAAASTGDGAIPRPGAGLIPHAPMPMAVPAKGGDAKSPEDAAFEARHYVMLALNGEAFQFTPLYEKVAQAEKDKPKPPAAGAPAVPGNSAVPKK